MWRCGGWDVGGGIGFVEEESLEGGERGEIWGFHRPFPESEGIEFGVNGRRGYILST